MYKAYLLWNCNITPLNIKVNGCTFELQGSIIRMVQCYPLTFGPRYARDPGQSLGPGVIIIIIL